MARVIRYWLVTAVTADKLSERVNQFVRMGWELHGPTFPNPPMYCQSVVSKLTDSEYDEMLERTKAIQEVEDA